ncbi:MAG: flagellar biosynthesis anti-sigma factor FlgM [Clostridiales bacterium]
MRIDKLYGMNAINKKMERAYSAGKSETKISSKDKLSISDKAKDFQSVMKALKQDDPVDRKNRINELEARVQSGNYKVSGDEIASKILSNGII